MIDELFENAKQTVGTKTGRTSITTHYLKSVVYTSCKGIGADPGSARHLEK